MATLGNFTSGQVLTAAELNAIGDAQTYTPTIVAGGTVGNGTITGTYVQLQNFVMFYIQFTLGSTSTITGDFQFSAPSPLDFGSNEIVSCTGFLTDASLGQNFFAHVRPFQTSLYVRPLTDDYGTGGYIGSQNMSATVPFTWTTGDSIAASGITVFA